ncbi:MAG: lysophospholipid acyltransferase family protein [Candidatus Rokubacteria bacterium]|nr:lysophospholipid acyltransferase family protein [Candidatus Rokubacteria bacterium]
MEGAPTALDLALDWALGLATDAARLLPRRAAEWLGRRAGDLAFVTTGRRRRTALANLVRAFPSLSPAERRRLCRRSYQHVGVMVMELFRMLGEPPERVLARVSIDGAAHLDAVMRSAGRALVLTAHLGNWEILPFAHRLTGHPLTVVVRPLDSALVNRLATRLRARSGVELIDKHDALRPVLTALRQGRLVGILMDQNASRREGVFVPFFGHPASTSRSVAVLALRTGAPILPIFIRRAPDGRHRVVIEPPLPIPETGGEAAVVELTTRCNQAIEAAILAAPEQWLWVHNRWRTRPAGARRGPD